MCVTERNHTDGTKGGGPGDSTSGNHVRASGTGAWCFPFWRVCSSTLANNTEMLICDLLMFVYSILKLGSHHRIRNSNFLRQAEI